MNTKDLSTEEIIKYVESGVVREISAEDFLRVIQDYKERVENSFDNGYETGYNSAESYFLDDYSL